MFRLRLPALAGCVLALSAFLVQAQETDLKAELKKTIDAHGGAEKLSKYGAATSKFKGTMELLGKETVVTGETTVQSPDKLKNDMKIDFNGVVIPIVQVYNGKKMWISAMGQTKEIDDEKILKETRETLQAEAYHNWPEYLKKPYELSAVGEAKIKGKDAVGIRISKKGQRDFTIYFDKKTHLVVKTETRSFDAMANQEVTQEKFILAYRTVQGIQVGSRVVIHKDGKLFMDLEISETKLFEKLDDATFAMP